MPTNILALDGGGTWALIQARTLGQLYGPSTGGHEILSHFDYAFANSGGSLVLGGLMIDRTPEQIEAYFTSASQRREMFRSSGPLASILRYFNFGPRYSTTAKHRQLIKVFGAHQFKSLEHAGRTTHFVIVAFDYVRSRSFFFRSEASSRFPTVAGATIAEAVHASTTAPVLYYDAPAQLQLQLRYTAESAPHDLSMKFWDGGVTGLNNPVAAAVAEALANGCAPDDIRVLSIGTGAGVRSNNPDHHGDPLQLVQTDVVLNRFKDVAKLARAVVGDPPDFASFLAHVMTGKRDPGDPLDTNVVRLSPLILGDYTAPRWRRPDWLDEDSMASSDRFARLVAMDMDAHTEEHVLDIRMLTEAWLADRAWNQPIRFDFFQDPARGIHAEIGHLRFSDASRRARDLGLVPARATSTGYESLAVHAQR